MRKRVWCQGGGRGKDAAAASSACREAASAASCSLLSARAIARSLVVSEAARAGAGGGAICRSVSRRSAMSSPKSTGCLQNGHGARFVGGFVRHTSVMHLRQKLWLHFVHARSMYGPRQIEHWTSDCCRWGRGGPSGSGRVCAPTGDFRYIYPLWTKPILHNNSNA